MQVAMQVASDSLGYFKKDSAGLRTPYPLSRIVHRLANN